MPAGTALEPVARHGPARNLHDRLRYAEQLAEARLLPSAYRGRPADVLVAIDTGEQLGIGTMAAITNIHVIEGKPTYSAALLAALVRRAGHRVRVTGDGESATAQVIRADDPGFTYQVTYTVDDARQANLLGKEVWRKFRRNMLKNRALAEVCRDACPDVFLGPVYVPEELGVEVDADGTPVGDDGSASTQDPMQKPDPTSTNEPVNAEVVDDGYWSGRIEQRAGNYAALRELWSEANSAGADQAVLDRIRTAGESCKPQSATPEQAAIEGGDRAASREDVADPVSDQVLCGGTQPEGVTRTGSDGHPLGLCSRCDQWIALTDSGTLQAHPATATEDASTPDKP